MSSSNGDSQPRLIPLFPLPSSVLLPGAVLPLYVFEPRYRTMMRSVVKNDEDSRFIAISLLRRGFEPAYMTKYAPTHAVTCVGRIVDYEQLPDGCYNLLLLGCARAIVVRENRRCPYRRALLGPHTSARPLNAGELSSHRSTLRVLLSEIKAARLIPPAACDQMMTATSQVVECIDLLAFHLFPPDDCELKQRVLEEPDPRIRANILFRWLRSTLDQHRRRSDVDSAWPPVLCAN